MLERFLGPVLVPRRYSRYLMLGCCLGVATILVVLSLFANYLHAVETQLLGIHPHLSIRATQSDRPLSAAELSQIEEALEGIEGITVARPALDRIVHLRLASAKAHPQTCRESASSSTCFDPMKVLGSDTVREVTGFTVHRAKTVRVRLRGLDLDTSPSNHLTTLELERVLDVRGKGLDVRRLAKGPLQGMPMAGYFERRLFHGAAPLDDFLFSALTTPAAHGTGRVHRTTEPEFQHFRLLSTLNLGLRQDAHPLVVTSLESAARILKSHNMASVGANTFEIRFENPRLATRVAERLSQHLDKAGLGVTRSLEAAPGTDGLEIRTWLEQDEGALRLLGVLHWVILVVASSVMVIAALCVMSTLSLVVLEGRQKIAMMRAMGLRDRNLYLALAFECLRIATVGLVTGLALGVVTSWTLLRIPGFAQGLGKMGVLNPQIMLQTGDLLAVALGTCTLFLMVAWWPAREACQIDPVSGLRG